MKSLPTLTLLLCLATAAATGKSAIIEGTETIGNEFPEVFALTFPAEDGSGKTQLCTGVLIHPEVILTAAHCIPTDPQTIVSVFSNNSARVRIVGTPAISYKAHPTYFNPKSELDPAGYDVGVVVLSAPMTAKPVQIASILDTADREAAFTSNLKVVGYGGKKSSGGDETTGIKRQGEAPLYELSRTYLATQGPKNGLSHGDSGGPAYLVDRNGERRLIGIASSTPRTKESMLTGLPEISYYAGMRPEIAAWIEEASGKKLSNSKTSEPMFGTERGNENDPH